MKLISILFILFTVSAYANEIENQELRLKDAENQMLNPENAISPTGTITPEKAAEIQAQIEQLKKTQADAQKSLEELDAE
jgi:hypothetical protein